MPLTKVEKRKLMKKNCPTEVNPGRFTTMEKLVFSYIYLSNEQISRIIHRNGETITKDVTGLYKKLGIEAGEKRVACLWKGLNEGLEIDDRYLHEYKKVWKK